MPYKEGKRWRAQVMFQGSRHSALFSTKREANAWESQKRKELQTVKSGKVSQGMDLKSFVAKYLDYSQRYVFKTYDEKRTLCRRILTDWGPDCLLADITPEMVLDYLNKRAKKQSPNAYNKDRKNLLAMFNWGKKILSLDCNPVANIEKMPWEREDRYVPPTKDILKVLAVANREERVFLYSYLLTGARRSEIFRWKWNDDINFQRKQYRLGTRKTRDGSMDYQWFEMPDDLYDELWWWWQNRPLKESPYVFVCTWPGPHYGKPYTYRRRFLKGLCERAGIKPFTFHALRSFFASVLADEQKVGIKTIQRLLRHRSFHTTERYLKNINRDLKASVDGLGSFIRKNLHEDLHAKNKG